MGRAGEVVGWAGEKLPDNALWCDGHEYNQDDYPQLYEIVGTIYGGTETTFRVPDLNGRVIVGAGNYPLNQSGGSERVKLVTEEMPTHKHYYSTGSLKVVQVDRSFAWFFKNDVLGAGPAGHTSSTGGHKSHENMPPFRVLNYIIYYE